MKKLTELEKIQKRIDKCNNLNGCNSKCSSAYQKECVILLSHSERIEYCKSKDMPIEKW